jgi:hypothetical protein
MTTGVAGVAAGVAEPAPFLEKTWKMLHDPDNQPYIDWTDDLTICVPKADDMAKHVLPKYFKHSNFCSFVRQLNTYGFKKIDNNPSNFEFKHEDALFRRGAKHLLLQIKRKAPNKRNVDTTQAGRLAVWRLSFSSLFLFLLFTPSCVTTKDPIFQNSYIV